MSGGGGETAAAGVLEDQMEKDRQPGPLPWCKQDLRDLPLPLYFATTPTNQPEGKGGRGDFSRGRVGVAGEGFVTPAGIGVSVPPRDKFLPPSLQFKLGTKSMCMFYFLVFIFFYFLLTFYFWFEREVQCVCQHFTSLCPLPNIQYRKGGSALLRPTIVQCC